jgi:surface antigen
VGLHGLEERTTMLQFRRAVALGAMAMSFTLGAYAHAQPMMNPLRQLALTSEDFAMVGEAVTGLYDAGKIGVTQTWSNPKSGNSGSVKILDTFEYQGLPCRAIEHTVKIRRQADPKQVVMKTCRDKDGIWKLI